MFSARCIVRGCLSRHPRRYLLTILIMTATAFLFWQLKLVHFYDAKKQNIERLFLQGPADHDHAHVKRRALSGREEYIEIPDVSLPSVNISVQFTGVSRATELCNQAGEKCKGVLDIRSRDSIVYILLPSLPPLGKGSQILFLKTGYVRDVSYINEVSCALSSHSSYKSQQSSLGCKLPKLDPFDPSVIQFMNPMDPMQCFGEMYTSYHGNVLKAVKTESLVDRIIYQPIRRTIASDVGYDLGEEKTLPLDGKGVKLNEDFLQVSTYLKTGETQVDLHAHVAPKEQALKRKRKDSGLPLNIIMLGMDGNSDANVQRLLPDTYKFLRDDLNAFIFKGFSLLGEATTPQLTGLLTGKSVEENCEAHEARKGVSDQGTVDEWPFIFDTLKEHGYVTMFSEDAPNIGAFHLRLNGFIQQPCDHYGRYFWWAAPQDGELGIHENCINSQPQHMLQLNYLRSLITSYPHTPKFALTFLGSLCHQSLNMVSSAAKDIHSFLKSLHVDGLLNDTMLVVFGDHGARFDQIRATLQGKLEERLPFLSIALPDWFRKKYPKFVKNLLENTQRIISPLDVHATFMHILKHPLNPSKSELTRGLSLFEEIPRSRECKDAGIPEHFCPCVTWEPVPATHPHVQIGTHLTVQHINSLLTQDDKVKALCHGLHLDTIISAVQEIRNKKMELFKGIKDGVGLGVGTPEYVDDDDERAHACSYQILFKVRPSMGLFESTVRIEEGRFKVSPDISRVNRYGTQPECIKESHPFLRKFCLCRH